MPDGARLASASPLSTATAAISRVGRPLPFDSDLHRDAAQWLVNEAWLLDTSSWDQWLALLSDDVHYLVPVRVTTAGAAGFDTSPGMAHFDEDKYSLARRVARFQTEHAWTEDPPSRMRHHLSNIRAFAASDPKHLVVESAVLLFRSRGDVHEGAIVSAGREDVLVRDGTSWKLARRVVLLDDSVIRMQNLAIFL